MKIHTIDCKFAGVEHTIASYLVEGSSGLALVETGPTSSMQNCLDGIRALGFEPTDVKHVLVTHIHFDHAGAAGMWAAMGAHVYVHHVGAPHLIDPTRLLKSAKRLYGDEMDSMWGEIRPIPESQATALYDNDTIEIGDLKFECWDTPGHATHHHTFVIDGVAFAGDVVGARPPGSKFIALTGAPPQFDPPAYVASIDRLLDAKLDRLFPTHFGEAEDAEDHLKRYREVVLGSAELTHALFRNGASTEELHQHFELYNRARMIRENGSDDAWLAQDTSNPVSMSADGAMLYWKRLAKKQAQQG